MLFIDTIVSYIVDICVGYCINSFIIAYSLFVDHIKASGIYHFIDNNIPDFAWVAIAYFNESLSSYGSPARYWRYVVFFTILGVIVVFTFKTVLSAFRFIWPYLLAAHIVAFAVFYHESLDKNKSGYHV